MMKKCFIYLASLLCVVAIKAENVLPLSCHDNINVSLDLNCSIQVQYEDVLTAIPAGQSFSLQIRDAIGNIIPMNSFDQSHLWNSYVAEVTSITTGNKCWGTVQVEDKMAPIISCDDITIDCFDTDNYLPTHFDNCSSSSLDLRGETIIPINCDMTSNQAIGQNICGSRLIW